MIRRYQVYQGKPAQPSQPDKITYHQLQLDELTQEVTKYGLPVELTDTEYSILLLLLMHPGQIFSTEHSGPWRGDRRVSDKDLRQGKDHTGNDRGYRCGRPCGDRSV